MSWSKRIVEGLGLRRSIVGALVMAVLVGMGDQMVERFVPIYLVALTANKALPGLFQALHNVVGALYAYPGGWLAERFGAKRALALCNWLAIAGYLFVILVPSWQAMLFGSLLFLSWSSISAPGTMGLISKSLPKHMHVMGVSLHSLVRRIPKALGPLLGGVCIDVWGEVDGVRAAFALAIVMTLASVFVQRALIEDDRQPKAPERPDPNPLRLFRSFSSQLKRLFVADLLIRFCEQIPYAYVTIWCMEAVAGHATARVSGTEFGLLTAIEMATAVACYIPVARWADRFGKKPFVLITFVNFTLFPAVLYFSTTFAMLVVAFVVRGLKEFGEPTRKALILQLAPADRQEAAFGTYYLFRDSILAVAAAGGALLWGLDPGVMLWSAFGCGVAGSLWFAAFGRGA
jgi:MFS family permease